MGRDDQTPRTPGRPGRRGARRLPPALRADQDPAHPEPGRRRLEAGRGDPARARARRALPGEPGHGAQGDRRARGGAHPGAPPGQGHVCRVAQRAVLPVPVPARNARFGRQGPSRERPRRASARPRRAGHRARASHTLGLPRACREAAAGVRRASTHPRRDRALREPVPGLERPAPRGIPRLHVQLLRIGLPRAHDPGGGAPARGGGGSFRRRPAARGAGRSTALRRPHRLHVWR